MTGAKVIEEKPGFQIPGLVPKHLWLSLMGVSYQITRGVALFCFWKGLASEILLAWGTG